MVDDNEIDRAGINRNRWPKLTKLSKIKRREFTVDPPKTTKGQGSNDSKLMQEMFPASPLHNGDLNTDELEEQKDVLLTKGQVSDGGHTFGTVDRDFSDTPNEIDIRNTDLINLNIDAPLIRPADARRRPPIKLGSRNSRASNPEPTSIDKFYEELQKPVPKRLTTPLIIGPEKARVVPRSGPTELDKQYEALFKPIFFTSRQTVTFKVDRANKAVNSEPSTIDKAFEELRKPTFQTFKPTKKLTQTQNKKLTPAPAAELFFPEIQALGGGFTPLNQEISDIPTPGTVLAEYDEGVVVFNNQTSASFTFNQPFTCDPVFVVYTIDSGVDNNDNINVFGNSIPTTTGGTIGTSAPFTGVIRYRATCTTADFPRNANSPFTASMIVFGGEVDVTEATTYTASFSLPAGTLIYYNTFHDVAGETQANVDLELQQIEDLGGSNKEAENTISAPATGKIHFIAYSL